MVAEFGYTGKILNVDLSQGSIVNTATMDYADRFIGGRGVAAKIYWDEVPPNTEPFDPENRLIFTTGPLAGFRGLAGSRWQICGKSPATNPQSFSYANLGGSWGAWLKFAGYDGMVVQGRSDRPVYLLVKNGNVEIREASFLKERGAIETRELLKGKLGRYTRVVAIGPAGENMAVMSNILADDDASGSGGLGAVMGSKQLKAIAVVANDKKMIASNPQKLQELQKYIHQLRQDSRSILGGRRATQGSMVPIFDPDLNPKLKKVACYGCISGCIRAMFEADNGHRGKSLCVGSVFYAGFSMGYYKEWNDVPFLASRTCNEYGLDVMTMIPMIRWLDKCYKSGVLTDEYTGLPLSKIGSLEFIQSLAAKISLRQEFGDILAQGTIGAADVLGTEAKEQLGDIDYRTGQIYAYEPRHYIITGLLHPMEPRLTTSLVHEVVIPIRLWLDWCDKVDEAYVSSDVIHRISKKFFGTEMALDFSTYEGKALVTKRIQDREYSKECLILCDFAWPMMDVKHSEEHVGDPALPSQVLSAVTGKEIDEQRLDKLGEKVFNLQRAILIREGYKGRESDCIPDFEYSVPISPKPSEDSQRRVSGKGGEIISKLGAVVNREEFEKMKEEYYQLRGWDPRTGFQKKDTLLKLDLGDIVEPLKEKVI
jgi:aldehyde:ferredoxin oxidoreductase